ncbi:MAG: DinB family protein [Euzebyales bacterium]|nr:DinB family protein [Euzebyales bacterium]
MLEAWLEYHRATLAMKCAGLDEDLLRERAVEPSSLSLLGLVRHMAQVERHWFRRVLRDEDVGSIWTSDEHGDADFDDVDTADVDEAFAAWTEECRRARAAVAAEASLDTLGRRADYGRLVSLRWILVHMIEEYARHNGHADLLRERLDGATGD